MSTIFFIMSSYLSLMLLSFLLDRPAPHFDFWRNNTYNIILPDGKIASILVKLDPKHQVCRIPSPVQPNISFPAEVVSLLLA